MNLLKRIRVINKLLLHTNGKCIYFKEMADALASVIDSNVFIVNHNGKILGYSMIEKNENEKIKYVLEEREFLKLYTDKFKEIVETEANLYMANSIGVFLSEIKDLATTGLMTIIPITGGGNRLGILILARINEKFSEEEMILGEYSAATIGIEILRWKNKEIEKEARSKAKAKLAISLLSYSELKAIKQIFKELDGTEGILVASRIADQMGIARSIITNALWKLESASLVEFRSLGMKGTFIKVLNDRFLNELEVLKVN